MHVARPNAYRNVPETIIRRGERRRWTRDEKRHVDPSAPYMQLSHPQCYVNMYRVTRAGALMVYIMKLKPRGVDRTFDRLRWRERSHAISQTRLPNQLHRHKVGEVERAAAARVEPGSVRAWLRRAGFKPRGAYRKSTKIAGIVSQPHTGQKATTKAMRLLTAMKVAMGMACGQ